MSAKRGTGADAPYRLGRSQSDQPGVAAAGACDVTFSLRRANTARPSGSWEDEDFDVFNGEQCVGRI